MRVGIVGQGEDRGRRFAIEAPPRTDGGQVIEVAGRRAAIDEAVALAGPGDVIALLGKGHERGQEIAGEVHPFDDRVELAAALTAKYGSTS